MLTRWQRRLRDEAARPVLVNLSDDLILQCAGHLLERHAGGELWRDVVAIERLGQCTKNLRRVCSDGSLWTHLSFPTAGARRLTDNMLAKLLTRVQAHTHMVSLSLTNCMRLDCSGLEPLRGSAVLRTIDLRRSVLDYCRPLADGARTLLRDLKPQLGLSVFKARDRSPVPGGTRGRGEWSATRAAPPPTPHLGMFRLSLPRGSLRPSRQPLRGRRDHPSRLEGGILIYIRVRLCICRILLNIFRAILHG